MSLFEFRHWIVTTVLVLYVQRRSLHKPMSIPQGTGQSIWDRQLSASALLGTSDGDASSQTSSSIESEGAWSMMASVGGGDGGGGVGDGGGGGGCGSVRSNSRSSATKVHAPGCIRMPAQRTRLQWTYQKGISNHPCPMHFTNHLSPLQGMPVAGHHLRNHLSAG